MKYCKYCGSEISQTYNVCPNCNKELTKTNKTLQTLTKVFMILTIVRICTLGLLLLSVVTLIPLMLETTFFIATLLYYSFVGLFSLLWLIPMCIYYFVRTKKNKKVGIVFKICCLIFGFFLPGIFMLCDND